MTQTRGKTHIRERLREQREDLRLQQGDIGAAMDPPIKQSTVSLYEREPLRLVGRGLEFTRSFFRQYRFDEAAAERLTRDVFSEFAEAFGQGESQQGALRIPGGLVMVPVLGVANGGRPGSYGLPVEPEMIRGDNTRAYQVEGNSMATNTADGGIRDGSWVLVDMSLTNPANGRVFLLEIIGDGMTVKRLRRFGSDWLFVSDNPDAGESWREDQVRIVGEVYGRVDYTEVR